MDTESSKSRAEQIMKPINVLTMGHDIGISASYYKPKEQEVLGDCLKASHLLTISNDNLILQKQMNELTKKSDEETGNIKDKLFEKEKQIEGLMKKQDMN
jgi:hypothetical protein